MSARGHNRPARTAATNGRSASDSGPPLAACGLSPSRRLRPFACAQSKVDPKRTITQRRVARSEKASASQGLSGHRHSPSALRTSK